MMLRAALVGAALARSVAFPVGSFLFQDDGTYECDYDQDGYEYCCSDRPCGTNQHCCGDNMGICSCISGWTPVFNAGKCIECPSYCFVDGGCKSCDDSDSSCAGDFEDVKVQCGDYSGTTWASTFNCYILGEYFDPTTVDSPNDEVFTIESSMYLNTCDGSNQTALEIAITAYLNQVSENDDVTYSSSQIQSFTGCTSSDFDVDSHENNAEFNVETKSGSVYSESQVYISGTCKRCTTVGLPGGDSINSSWGADTKDDEVPGSISRELGLSGGLISRVFDITKLSSSTWS